MSSFFATRIVLNQYVRINSGSTNIYDAGQWVKSQNLGAIFYGLGSPFIKIFQSRFDYIIIDNTFRVLV